MDVDDYLTILPRLDEILSFSLVSDWTGGVFLPLPAFDLVWLP